MRSELLLPLVGEPPPKDLVELGAEVALMTSVLEAQAAYIVVIESRLADAERRIAALEGGDHG